MVLCVLYWYQWNSPAAAAVVVVVVVVSAALPAFPAAAFERLPPVPEWGRPRSLSGEPPVWLGTAREEVGASAESVTGLYRCGYTNFKTFSTIQSNTTQLNKAFQRAEEGFFSRKMSCLRWALNPDTLFSDNKNN